MDYSTISNKTNVTEMEDITNGELSERYYLLKKQYENLSASFESNKQELHDVRRSYNTALDVQSHLTVELESHQAEEQKRRSELNSRITSLQEEISALREERRETQENHSSEVTRLQTEIKRLKEETNLKESRESPERSNTAELDELRSALHEAFAKAEELKQMLEVSRTEAGSWQMRAASLTEDMAQMKESSELRREEVRAANEREAVALAELAEVRAMLHQCTNPQDVQPHAAKGNSLFAEVEDKRQEMAKTLIQMKQTNSKLRRELANKQVEVDTLLHEKQTIWEQQLGASAHYDRELIESYEERISQLEALTERQRRELARWFGKQCEPTASGWLAGVLDHLKSECEKLRQEVLSRGAAQLASAAQVRDLRRKLAATTTQSLNKNTPKPSPKEPEKTAASNVKEYVSITDRTSNVKEYVPDRTSSVKEYVTDRTSSVKEYVPDRTSSVKEYVSMSDRSSIVRETVEVERVQKQRLAADDVKKRVTFN